MTQEEKKFAMSESDSDSSITSREDLVEASVATPKPIVEIEAAGSEPAVESFGELGVCADICAACDRVGWKKPTPIQQKSIPHALQKRDLIALAETGSGKTGAFAIPILQALLEHKQRMFAVVLAPTRELCVQIADTFEALGAEIALATVVLMGGMDMTTQQLALAKKPHVIVASPGRLVDHLTSTKGFHISGIKFLVMDEADRLLSMDFGTAIDQILEAAPVERQTFLFSATMTSKVSKLQRASLRKPVKVEINSKYDTVSTLIQNYVLVPFKVKQTYLVAILEHLSTYSGIVFVDTCLNAQKMATMLKHLGFQAVCLHGQMNQTQRLHSLNSFKAGQRSLLIATDVAARGLDIPQVDIVVNFDIPKNSKDYVHRVGRTARAGRSGRSITFVTQYDVEGFQKIETLIGLKMEEYSEVSEDQAMTFHERVLEALRSAHIEMKEREQEIKETVSGKKRNLLLKKKRAKMLCH
jgi:ATP-dependent RNA helicase DDX47/RRP3